MDVLYNPITIMVLHVCLRRKFLETSITTFFERQKECVDVMNIFHEMFCTICARVLHVLCITMFMIFFRINLSRTIQITEFDNYKYNLNHHPTSKCIFDTGKWQSLIIK